MLENESELEITYQEQVQNWLQIAFSQSNEKFSEMFYYDIKNKQFFSILVTDYFHFDENFNIPKNTKSTYSNEILKLLKERILKIENNAPDIIPIPRLGNKTLNFNEEISDFLDRNTITIESTSIWDIDEIGNVTINLSSRKWWEFWK
ncbi:hypothetical protein SY27_02065 [Flavobacterium sp. 316]|uniref:hypothetical protein n=1 Tax=Flavobacterium sp. 316 TaxID=1603293 RepID=UPI0005DB0190|nr:hypothetical protein [Flavobacterium sp. 316]KIX22635.1 hypothetical protein SY27_02065 [Flavobacterium sp. 316]